MEIIGIITGDIVKSSRIKADDKDVIINEILGLKDDVSTICSIDIEFFRGDSFQILVRDATRTLFVAVLLRAKLRGESKGVKCDARLSVGVGGIEYVNERVVMSDGEAFRLSGRGLDEIGKKSRLVVATKWSAVNNELAVSTPFADDIISKWTTEQAAIIFVALSADVNQKDISFMLGKSVQNVSKLLTAAKEQLVRMYLNRFVELINSNVNGK